MVDKKKSTNKTKKSNKSGDNKNKNNKNSLRTSESLAVKYRPRKLDDIVGQDSAVNQIKGMLKRKQIPSAILIAGPSGAGKTTIARILAHTVNDVDIRQEDPNTKEINISDERGIDNVRQNAKFIQFKPSSGGNIRFMIMDECFIAGTQVLTEHGSKSIEDIKSGEYVLTRNGYLRVNNTFANNINLDNVIRLDFSDNSHVICTFDHLFYTLNRGWVKAGNLCSTDELYRTSHVRENLFSLPKLIRDKNTKQEIMRFLQACKINLQELWQKIQESTSKTGRGFETQILFSDLCWSVAQPTTRVQKENLQQESKESYKQRSKKVQERRPREVRRSPANAQQPDEIQQSNKKSRNSTKNIKYQEKERYSYSSALSWWKWRSNTGTSVASVQEIIQRTLYRICYSFRQEDTGLSYKLQSRLGISFFKIGNRIGRLESQYKRQEKERQKERSYAEPLRVESITFFKSTSNSTLWQGCFSDQERAQGITTFYDLEVEGQHEYFVNGILVHNCHSLTHQGASALLKPLEEPPEHSCFILCTDQPERLLETIRNRCQKIVLNMPEPKDLVPMLQRICDAEDISFGKKQKETLNKVAENARGVPRESIQMLEAVNNAVQASGSNVSKKNIDKHIHSALKAVMDIDSEMVALKTLLSIYAGKPHICIQACKDTTDFRGLMFRLFDLNQYLIEVLSNSNTYHTVVRRKLVDQLESKNRTPSLRTALDVHSCLVDLQTQMKSYLVGEPHLVISYLGEMAYKVSQGNHPKQKQKDGNKKNKNK